MSTNIEKVVPITTANTTVEEFIDAIAQLQRIVTELTKIIEDMNNEP